MTLKTSWFDFGIYKNALRRFKWGSVLYFVILFFAVPFAFFVGSYSYNYYRLYTVNGTLPQMIVEQDFLIVPILMAYAVSVIVAVILHRYMHENRQGIAVHSLPVTRRVTFCYEPYGLWRAFRPCNGTLLDGSEYSDTFHYVLHKYLCHIFNRSLGCTYSNNGSFACVAYNSGAWYSVFQ